jgi:hypothetical protein
MKPRLWYHTAERQPDKSGYYLSFRGWGIAGKGDCDSDWGYVYYDKKVNEWRDYESTGHYAFVYYWTDAQPDDWVNNETVSKKKKTKENNAALKIAWADVLAAVERYELIKVLSRDVHS